MRARARAWHNPPSLSIQFFDDGRDVFRGRAGFEDWWDRLTEQVYGERVPKKLRACNIDSISRSGAHALDISFVERPKRIVLEHFVLSLCADGKRLAFSVRVINKKNHSRGGRPSPARNKYNDEYITPPRRSDYHSATSSGRRRTKFDSFPSSRRRRRNNGSRNNDSHSFESPPVPRALRYSPTVSRTENFSPPRRDFLDDDGAGRFDCDHGRHDINYGREFDDYGGCLLTSPSFSSSRSTESRLSRMEDMMARILRVISPQARTGRRTRRHAHRS